jgi:hypothetical protein
MRHKLYILIIAVSTLCVFLIGCTHKNEPNSGQTHLSDTNNSALAWILNGDYKTVKSFYDLPKDVRTIIIPEPYEFQQNVIDSFRKNGWTEEQIKKEVESNKILFGRMANTNERFNSTDAIEEDLPMRRFITGGFSKDYAFVFYEHGGIGYNQPLVILKRNNEKAEMMFMGVYLDTSGSLEDLKAIIKNNKIEEIKNPENQRINM